MIEVAQRTERFVALFTERCVPAVIQLEHFDLTGLRDADPELAEDFLRGEAGRACVPPEDDMLIYQSDDTSYCGVMSDPVDRVWTLEKFRDWAAASRPPFTEIPDDEPSIALIMRAPHPKRGRAQVLLSFESESESESEGEGIASAHASAAWVTED